MDPPHLPQEEVATHFSSHSEAYLYMLAFLPVHLKMSRSGDRLARLLTDAQFLQAKTSTYGVNALIGDFALVEESESESQAGLALIRDAIALSADTVIRNPASLGIQLLGRLSSQNSPLTQKLLSSFAEDESVPIVPITAALTKPAGALRQSLVIESEKDIGTLLPDLDAQLVAYADVDGRLVVRELGSGKVICDINLPLGHRVLAFHASSEVLTANDQEVLAIALDTGTYKTLWRHSQRCQIHLDRNGAKALMIDGRQIEMIDLWTGVSVLACKLPFAPDDAAIAGVGSRLALTTADTLFIVDVTASPTRTWSVSLPKCDEIERMSLSPDGRKLVLRCRTLLTSGFILGDDVHQYDLYLWTDAKPSKLRVIRRDTDPSSFSFSGDGTKVLLGSAAGHITIFDLQRQRTHGDFLAHPAPIHALWSSYCADGCVSLDFEGRLRVWRFANTSIGTADANMASFQHAGPVTAVTISPDASFAASADASTIMVWDVAAGCVKHVFRWRAWWQPRSVLALGLLQEPPIVIAAGARRVRMWDLRTNREIWSGRLRHSTKWNEPFWIAKMADADVRSFPVAISDDSSILASARTHETVGVWHLSSGQLLGEFRGSPMTLGVSTSAGFIVSAHYNDVYLTDLHRLQPLSNFTATGGVVAGIAINSEARIAITAHANGALRAWDLLDGTLRKDISDVFTEMEPQWSDQANYTALFHNAPMHLDKSGRIAVVADDRQIKIISLERGSILARHSVDYHITQCRISNDARSVVAGDESGHVHLLSCRLFPTDQRGASGRYAPPETER